MSDEGVVLQGRRPWAGLWFGIAAFGAVFGVIMVAGGAWAGWFLVLVFVPSAVLLGMALRPEANQLTLDDAGYTIGTTFRSQHVAWADVERIGVHEGTKEPLVAIRLSPRLADLDPDAAEIAAAMGGYHRTLPLTYGLDAADLAAMMRRFAGL